MTTILGSARNTGVTILDTVTQTATMFGDAIGIASRGLDMLAVQTENMHKRVTTESNYALVRDLDDIENRYALEILEQRVKTSDRIAKLGVTESEVDSVVNLLKSTNKSKPHLAVAAE